MLYRYVQLYGELTPAAVSLRQRKLAALATGTLERQLSASIPHAPALAGRALAPRTRTMATVESAEVGPCRDRRCTGVAIVSERLVPIDGSAGAPLTTVYFAQLWLTARGWRVASFVPAP